MIEQAFDVAAEFKFDVGEALLNTKALTGAVDELSNAADGAMTSLGYLAGGLVAHLGLGSGGLLGILKQAVQVSEDFNHSALEFSNSIMSNFKLLSGDINTFNDRLKTSENIMDGVSNTAIKFGVDQNSLSAITQLIASPLAARGKLGTNYAGGIDMAKNMMLASESVGLPQHMGAEMLARALSPGQSVGGKMFERLVNTDAFRGSRIIHPQQLATMNQDKKIELLSKALQQLAGDAEFLAARMNHIGAQFTVFKNQIMVILKPIGDALVKPLVMMMKQANTYLAAHGKEMGDNIAKFIGDIFGDPEKLMVNLLQLKRFKGDFKHAVDISSFLFLFASIGKLLKPIKPLAMWVEEFLGLKSGAGFLTILSSDAGIFAKIFKIMNSAVADFIPVVGELLFFFQVISRALAIAKIHDTIAMVQLIPRAMALFGRMKAALDQILMPITMAIDGLARMLAPLFESSILYEFVIDNLTGLTWILEGLGTVINVVMSIVAALTNVLLGFIFDVVAGVNPLKNLGNNLKEGFTDFYNAHKIGQSGANPTVNQVTNIGKIEARFDMREQLEPDRVAFSVVTHLKKLAVNKRQTQGAGSFDAAFVGPTVAGFR